MDFRAAQEQREYKSMRMTTTMTTTVTPDGGVDDPSVDESDRELFDVGVIIGVAHRRLPE